jgi:hypothetical protein
MYFSFFDVPGIFMRVMTQVFKPFMKKILMVYFDNILIYSKTKEEPLNHLIRVYNTLRKESLFVNVNKCSFFADQVVFLGFIMSYKEVSTDP